MCQYTLWGGRREGRFVVHCIYFMATDFKQISDSPYCLIICLGGWAIYELLAFAAAETMCYKCPIHKPAPQIRQISHSNL